MAYLDGIAEGNRLYNIADGKWYDFIRHTIHKGETCVIVRSDTGFNIVIDREGCIEGAPRTFFWDIPAIIAPRRQDRDPKTFKDLVDQDRYGWIKLDPAYESIFSLDELNKIFSGIFVTHRTKIEDGSVMVHAYSKYFRKANRAECAPVYLGKCSYQDDNLEVTWEETKNG